MASISCVPKAKICSAIQHTTHFLPKKVREIINFQLQVTEVSRQTFGLHTDFKNAAATLAAVAKEGASLVATIGVFLAGTTSQDEANFSPGIPQIPLMVVSAIRIN